MAILDLIVQSRIGLVDSLAEDHHHLTVVRRPSRSRIGTLRVYELAGNLLSIGRYHLAPIPSLPAQDVRLFRRLSGGRVVSSGQGFVGVALVLPHRSALVSENPFALAPFQVINRCVRGLLDACRLAGVSAHYPGRDLLTVQRRALAMVSFEIAAAGAMLFEAVLANGADFSSAPARLDAVDPAGVIKAEFLTPDRATCFATEIGAALSIEEVADLVARGFMQQFGVTVERRALTSLEQRAIKSASRRDVFGDRWLHQRVRRPGLNLSGSERTQLGFFEAFFALKQGRFIKDVCFAGDFIANSAAINRLERELRLCPAEWRAIDAVASDVLSAPENFILGIGPTRVIADTICKGIA